uniref:Coiled-coil domain-containing protein 86 n=1 Tax=Anopheles culicifacies TaxID=139723 RepID=A0A182MQ60_9DIPT
MKAGSMRTSSVQSGADATQKATTQNSSYNTAEETSIRGKPKSGRIWKSQKERFATVKKSLRGKTPSQQIAYRNEIKQIKQLSQSIKDAKHRENEEKRLRREENKRRRLENAQKSEIVQVIKNPAKLKRMRKKHLRMIEKRDLSKLNVV